VASRLLISRSRRLLNPAFEISGSADGEAHPPTNERSGYRPPYELGILIRAKIKSGSLFILPDSKCWAGPATGKKTCVACDATIIGGAECELDGWDGSV